MTEVKTIENNHIKLLSPKIDVVFHALFNKKNNHLTEAFLSDILNQKVKIQEYLDRNIETDFASEKIGIMDLNVVLENNTKCSIEIQLAKLKYSENRFVRYLSKNFSSGLNKNEDYSNIKKTIIILILDYETPKMNNNNILGSKWHIANDDTHLVLTDDFELCIIEIRKAIEVLKKDPNNRIGQWMKFLDSPEEVSEIMKENKDIEDAYESLKYVSEDKDTARLAELRLKAIWDEKAAIEYARDEGFEKGKKQALENTVKNLLKKNIDIQTIIEVTGLTKEEILKLK